MATTLAGSAPHRGGVLARLRSSFDIRYYALATTLTTYGLIVLGGTVRATDSGEACPDWPLCHGNIIPPMETKVWVEFSHRLVASVVGFLIAGLVYAIWRRRHQDGVLWRAGILAGLLLVLQVLVGGATVGSGTAAGVVAIHLSIALSLLTTLIFITARLFRSQDLPLVRAEVLPSLVLAGVFALVISGAFVSQKHAGLAYPDWPLFDGKVTPAHSTVGELHYLHRVVAGGVGLLFFALLFVSLRSQPAQGVVWGLCAATVLFIAQALLGAANVWLELATSVRILHLALASAVWGVLVFTMAWAYQNGLRLTKGNS
ncbi:MAG TPA: COX15/CtaA family protein [Dehalococcoidia bacterium]|jgi:heme A synthase|nr:COX15/CtaA family protein [Dehalococcoidia bacterium]